MALVQVTAVDKIEVVNATDIPMVQVRTATWVEDDVTGEKFGAPQWSRKVVAPDADTTNEPTVVKGIANAVHTVEVKAAYQARLAQQALDNIPS